MIAVKHYFANSAKCNENYYYFSQNYYIFPQCQNMLLFSETFT